MRNEDTASRHHPQGRGHHELHAVDLVVGSPEIGTPWVLENVSPKRLFDVKRRRKLRERTKRRQFIKDMEKLGYEVTGFEPRDKVIFRKVKTWQGEIAARDSNGVPSETSGSSHGLSKAALASARRALQASKKLKASSTNGAKREDAAPDRVIRPKFS
jgi:hypothetical protein